MAFKKMKSGKRKPQMHSLIDMSFILLLFFLVTSMIVQMKEKEQKLQIPTPKNEPGRAQILVQFLDEANYFYLDQTANSIVEDVKNNFGWQPLWWQHQEIVRRFLSERKYDKSKVLSTLTALKNRAHDHPEETYFILIRCPDALPYYHVIDIIQAVAGETNIQYGCVGGSFSDIEHARKIDLRVETDAKKQRSENLVIEF